MEKAGKCLTFFISFNETFVIHDAIHFRTVCWGLSSNEDCFKELLLSLDSSSVLLVGNARIASETRMMQ